LAADGSFSYTPEAPLPGELAGASPTERLYEGKPAREEKHSDLRRTPPLNGMGKGLPAPCEPK
jgi:hypothetical protein